MELMQITDLADWTWSSTAVFLVALLIVVTFLVATHRKESK